MSALPQVAFAGIGLMGLPMCKRLLAAGFPLLVWNRSADKCQALAELGAKVVEHPMQLCEAQIVLLCLADTAAVNEVVFSAQGLSKTATSQHLLVDLSSSDPAETRVMAVLFEQRCGARWLDAPVSGGTPGAQDGSLAIMVGGRVEDVERARPVLMQLGQRVTHMGGVGAGQVSKVCNQMIVASNALVIAEVVALAERAGVDAGLLATALQGGFADSKPLQILVPQMSESRFEPVKWHVRTLLKDLNTALKLSVEQKATAPMTAVAATLMAQHASAGYLDKDPATLVQLHRDVISETGC